MKKLMIVACAALSVLVGCSTAKPFGVTAKGEKVSLYTLKGRGGLTLEVTDYGGRVVRCWAPDKNDNLADVTIGWNTVEEYEKNGFSMGTLIGRYGNRIAHGNQVFASIPDLIELFYGHHFALSSFCPPRYRSRMPGTWSGVSRPYTSSLMVITGASPQAPTQRQLSIENKPSGVHSPALIPK